MNGSRCRIGGPRRSAVGTGRIRLNSSPSLTRTKGVSREGPCPWRIDGLTTKNLEVEMEVEMSMQAGERVGDRALRRQATVKAGKTVVLGMLAAASMGAMGAMQASSQMPFASIALAIPAVSAEALASAFRSAWAGLAAGCLHTLAGADHLAALTPLTIGQSHLRASMLGALWGFGHSTGQLMLGLAMVLLKDRFSEIVPAITKWGGAIVGLTLLAIGVLGVYESYFDGGHEHHHHHHHHHGQGHSNASGDTDPVAQGSKPKKKTSLGSSLATFATGIIYGLQPDALFVIIPALALPTKLAATAFIIAFVLGTVGAMGAYAGVIGATTGAISKSKNSWLTNNLSGAASAVAILIGTGILLGSCGIHTPLAIA